MGTSVIFGLAGAEPILGVTALESAGIEVDPRTQRLKKLPAIRLKPARPARPGSGGNPRSRGLSRRHR